MTKKFLALAILLFLGQVTFSCTSKDCGCFKPGSVDNTCDEYEVCNCKPNFATPKCDSCAKGFFWFPKCWEGYTKNPARFTVVGFKDDTHIHGTGKIFNAPGVSGDEESNTVYELFVDTNKEYKNIVGGIVGIKCNVWLFGEDGSQKSFEIDRFGGISQKDNANIDISKVNFLVQTDEDHLVGLTDDFSVYSIENLDNGWSLLKRFPPGSNKVQEWGDILCATIDSKKVAVVTSGPKSRIMYFNLNTKDWTEGVLLGNLKKGAGSCSMMEEDGHIFVKSPHINTVFDVTTGKEKDDYFERNDLPNSISKPTIIHGKFGQALFGGSSDHVFYLPKGKKEWIKSKQQYPTTTRSIGCLFDKSNDEYVFN